MINLMPTDLKQTYQYAHRNTKLLSWLAALGVGLIGLVGITLYGTIYINQTAASYNHENAITKASLTHQQLSQVETNVQSISDSFELVVRVLSQEVLFSKLLEQLATITPANVNLTSLDISNVQGGIDITAEASDYNAATQLEVNLADPTNKLFSKADIESISCSSGGASTTTQTDPGYPCDVVVRALFTANNPFLFINNSNAKAGS
jgi:Tfp pilus assembly protein PilN